MKDDSHGPDAPLQASQGRRFDRRKVRRAAIGAWLAGLAGALALFPIAVLAAVPPVIATAIAAGAALLWLVHADRWMRLPGGIPCLTWHSVSESPGWLPWAEAISVRPQTLDRQLGLLRRMGLVSMDSVEFVRRRRYGLPVPAKTVLLHFDDGYRDNLIAAAPLLERHGMRATMFVSTNFIAPDGDEAAVSVPLDWKGYLNWAELSLLDGGAFGGAFDIQAHGVDHGRVAVSGRIVDRLSARNWRQLAWMQWAATAGDKHDWFLHETPWAVPLGTPVPESDGALAARAWIGDRLETRSEYRDRVRDELRACRATFRNKLGREPQLFCWPQNLTSDDARQIAAEEGYLATTGGHGANRTQEPADILSRVHVGERVAGFHCAMFDDIAFRATVRCFQGNHYWYLPIVLINAVRLVWLRLSSCWPTRRAVRQ